ncbi:hypothetical protein ACWKWN_13485 [Microbacterium trichothecenolyticum]
MSSSKRHADHFDRLMDERILQRLAAEHPLQSLTDRELQRDTLPITRDPQPKPCHVWVRFGPHAVLVRGTVAVWNDIACGVEFTVDGKPHRCWVWANAVQPVSA